MPWPNQGPCEGHSSSGSDSDTVADPNDCTCFYKCSEEDNIAGTGCCLPGLGFNPETLICDWLYNLPDCGE